jgi:xanthine dehydrogenase accessory factor
MDPFIERLQREDAVLVTVEATQGSVPRERGAWMGVFEQDVVGTVGGGHVEFAAIVAARQRLRGEAAADVAPVQRFALGPSLGQCCGGVMHLRFERVTAADRTALEPRLARELVPVALFGGGHVGRAIVQALAPLPFAITWIDSRDEVFPSALPPTVRTEHSDPVDAAVADLASGARVLIMSFSHAEDLDVVAACLRRARDSADLPFIGLIGSATKWATFRHRLAQRGFGDADFARVSCPIGLPGVAGKEPAVIAASVAVQLLQVGVAPA